MKLRTNVKAGGLPLNHNESQVRDHAAGMRVKILVKSGAITSNHNETQVRERN